MVKQPWKRQNQNPNVTVPTSQLVAVRNPNVTVPTSQLEAVRNPNVTVPTSQLVAVRNLPMFGLEVAQVLRLVAVAI
jgi:hypothetical protein